MARRKPPAARGGLYEFGAEIDIPVASLDEFDAAIRDANEKGKWLGTDENIEAVIVGAENQAWAIIGPALGISERAERFYRLPGEAWRPYTGQRLEPVVGAVYCFAEALPKHAKGADPRLEWAGRILSFTRRLRDALAEGRAGVAARPPRHDVRPGGTGRLRRVGWRATGVTFAAGVGSGRVALTGPDAGSTTSSSR